MYTIRDNKHKNDRVHGSINNNDGIVISVSTSLSVQLDNDEVLQ